MDKERDTYFDLLRGIAIIMVVGIHTYGDGLLHFNLIIRQLLNCAVPIFLAISGYFIGLKSFEEKGSYSRFLKKQITRVYFPMLFWSIPWVLLSIKAGSDLWQTLLTAFFGGVSIFYFITLIIQYYVLTPVIQKVNISNRGGYSVILTIVGISLFDYLQRIQGVKLSLLEAASPFIVWMVFYVMGTLKAQKLDMPITFRRPLIGVALGIVLSCIHILWFYHYYGCVVPGIKLSSHIYTYFVVLWLFSDDARKLYNKVKVSKTVKWIEEVGTLSFFIYLNHCLFIFAISVLHVPHIWFLRWPLCILLSYMFAKICYRKCPNAIKKYVGL